MLRTLLKKQMTEIFRAYFYNPKKNQRRSVGSTVALFLGFGCLLLLIAGALVVTFAISLCDVFATNGMDWMYFTMIGLFSIVMGAFGSVFNTYSGLYLSKDNDLLLSMPIPVRCIIASRLLSVYLMGTLYAGMVYLPAMIVYWVRATASFSVVFGSLLLFVLISLFVLTLSCLLGWVIAKISLKLKNRGILTTLFSLVFIGIYYAFYFRAQELVGYLVEHAAEIGEKIRGAAYPIYLIGCVGTGDWVAELTVGLVVFGLFALTCVILSRSFLRIATATGKVVWVAYKEKTVKAENASSALLRKEFRRFTGSANYMLNCGFGTLFLPAAGIFLLIKGRGLIDALNSVFEGSAGIVPVLACAAACLLASMNDTAAPSVSLEGKNLWLLQSLPVSPFQVLLAKAKLQIIITGIPMIFFLVCTTIVTFPVAPVETVFAAVVALLYVPLAAFFALFLGLRHPNLTWSNEIIPIKQSTSVMVALFSGWGYGLVLAGGYFLFGTYIGAIAYLGIFAVLSIALIAVLVNWHKTKGCALFAAL